MLIRKPGDKLSLVKGDNPLTGPFYIEGAEPGDTLGIKFLDIEVDGNQGVGAFAPGFGAAPFLCRCVHQYHTPIPIAPSLYSAGTRKSRRHGSSPSIRS